LDHMKTASWSHIAATDLSICLIMQLTKPFNAHSSRWIQFRTCKADVGVEYVPIVPHIVFVRK
jgi:hypothetical protein